MDIDTELHTGIIKIEDQSLVKGVGVKEALKSF